jgi:hypothetical protein
MQRDETKIPKKFVEKINALRQICTEKNMEQVHQAVLKTTAKERGQRIETDPDEYVAIPICFMEDKAKHDEFEVFWAIYAPGPYEGIDGLTTRRSVDLGLVVQDASKKKKRPTIEIIPHGLCFLNQDDAEAHASMLSLASMLKAIDTIDTIDTDDDRDLK